MDRKPQKTKIAGLLLVDTYWALLSSHLPPLRSFIWCLRKTKPADDGHLRVTNRKQGAMACPITPCMSCHFLLSWAVAELQLPIDWGSSEAPVLTLASHCCKQAWPLGTLIFIFQKNPPWLFGEESPGQINSICLQIPSKNTSFDYFLKFPSMYVWLIIKNRNGMPNIKNQ